MRFIDQTSALQLHFSIHDLTSHQSKKLQTYSWMPTRHQIYLPFLKKKTNKSWCGTGVLVLRDKENGKTLYRKPEGQIELKGQGQVRVRNYHWHDVWPTWFVVPLYYSFAFEACYLRNHDHDGYSAHSFFFVASWTSPRPKRLFLKDWCKHTSTSCY